MKPSKHCKCCGKPIWDYGYITSHDRFMDIEIYEPTQCAEAARRLRCEQIERRNITQHPEKTGPWLDALERIELQLLVQPLK